MGFNSTKASIKRGVDRSIFRRLVEQLLNRVFKLVTFS